MNYSDLCKSIGIDRDEITKKCADPVNPQICKEPLYFTKKIGPRHRPPTGEDLSHMVSKPARQISDKLRKPKTK